MYVAKESIVLASGSPRRREYLEAMGIEFTVEVADIDEQPLEGEPPDAYVLRMARDKALSIASRAGGSCVIGGDTIVCLGPRILGKPVDKDDAVRLLMSLSGKQHEVKTAICVVMLKKNILVSDLITTKVFFRNYSCSLARAYVETGESLDKAGAYGIQGKGAFLVRAIEGSYTNVVGLPVHELIEILMDNKIVEVAVSKASEAAAPEGRLN